jgi:hypothetical protein
MASALAAWFSFDALEESLYLNGALLTGKMNIHFCRSESAMALGFNWLGQTIAIKVSCLFMKWSNSSD